MVKVNTGPLGATQASGKIAGGVYSRNRFGMYIRNLRTPVNPQSSRQTAVRTSMAFLTAAWSQTLTQAQRNAWDLYGKTTPMLDKFGNPINLTGFQQFLRSNIQLKRAAKTVVAAGPTVFELPEQDPTFAITVSEAAQLISVTFDDTMEWCDEDQAFMWVSMGTPQNPQRTFFNGPWRIASAIEGDSVAPPTSPETMAVPFVVAEDERVWCYARIQRADGRLSEPFQVDVAVGA